MSNIIKNGIALKIIGGFALLTMLVGAILITKFYFIDEWADWGNLNENRLKSNATLVTAFFVLGTPPPHTNNPQFHSSFQTALDRHHSFLRLLLLLRLPIVLFTDSYSAKFALDIRKSIGMENCTKAMEKGEAGYTIPTDSIWNISVTELPLHTNSSLFHSIIEEEQNENGWHTEWDPELRHRPETRSLDFHILANSKSYFLRNVSVDNPFNATIFIWLDPTYGHGQPSFFPRNFEWTPTKLPADKITLLKASPPNDSLLSYGQEDIYHRDLSLVKTEFFAGDNKSIEQFHSIFQQKILYEAVTERVFDEDDQTILVLLIKEHPKLFNLVQGQWFNAFHLF